MRNAMRLARRNPLALSVGVASCKTGLADAITQTCVEDRSPRGGFDWRRNAAFWVFGAWFLGGAQYLVLVGGMRAAFPGLGGYMAAPVGRRVREARFHRLVVAQSLFEMGVWVPFVYFPMYYCTRMGIQGSTGGQVLGALRANWCADLRAYYAAWVPFTLANYYLTPLWARVPAIGAYSMLWTVYLSMTRGSL